MRLTLKRVATAPDPIERPRLAHFLWERGMTFREAAGPLSRSHEYVRRLCLPYGDPKRITPNDDDLAAIAELTGGTIGKPDFEPAGAAAEAVGAKVLAFGRSS